MLIVSIFLSFIIQSHKLFIISHTKITSVFHKYNQIWLILGIVFGHFSLLHERKFYGRPKDLKVKKFMKNTLIVNEYFILNKYP